MSKTTKTSKMYDDVFCEKCDNILDVSRTPFNATLLDTTTPVDVSTDHAINYEDILKKVENGEKISEDVLRTLDVKEMVKTEYYKKMAKKGDVKKVILDMIDDMGNSDQNINAYLVCRNCSFTKQINHEMKILVKNPEGVPATHEYVNENALRNRVYARTMPRTRNFNCPNKDCASHKQNVPTEAVFFRKDANTYETIYVCCNCLSVKVN